MSRMFAEMWGRPTLSENGREPIEDFSQYALERLGDQSSRRGLWSSLGPGFYRHLEVINEVYDYWCINDHVNAGLHQGMLISRKDFCKETGTTDDEWLENRNNCWVQKNWSASINHQGAHFCEVAAAIDNLFYDGKYAWPVEKGWWQRTPEEFGDQLHLCNHCALAQPGPSVVAHDDIDIVSRENLELLKAKGSPAVRKNQIEVYDPKNVPEHRHKARDFRIDWYMPEPHMRVSPDNSSIKPHRIAVIVTCVGYSDVLAKTLKHNQPESFDQYIIVTTPEDKDTRVVVESWRRDHECDTDGSVSNVQLVISDRCHDKDHAFNKGRLLNDGLAVVKRPDWILFTDADIYLNENTEEYIRSHVLNPGCLYYTKRIDDGIAEGGWDEVNAEANGFFQLWNRRALAIRDRWPAVMSEEFVSACGIDTWFANQFDCKKRIAIPHLAVRHKTHGKFGSGWNGTRTTGWRDIGWITSRGLWAFAGDSIEPGDSLKLTDTMRGQSVTLRDGDDLMAHIERGSEPGTLKFMGQEIGVCQIVVARRRDG